MTRYRTLGCKALIANDLPCIVVKWPKVIPETTSFVLTAIDSYKVWRLCNKLRLN